MKKLTVAVSMVCLIGILAVKVYPNDDNKYLNPTWQKDSTKMLTQNECGNVNVDDCLYRQNGPHKAFVKNEIAEQKDWKQAIKIKSKDKKEFAKLTDKKSFDFEVKPVATVKHSIKFERSYKTGKTVSEFKGWKESGRTREVIFRPNFVESDDKEPKGTFKLQAKEKAI